MGVSDYQVSEEKKERKFMDLFLTAPDIGPETNGEFGLFLLIFLLVKLLSEIPKKIITKRHQYNFFLQLKMQN